MANGIGSWSFVDVPPQDGRTALVTGANSGLGFETAQMLAARGAEVILACRNRSKGEAAMERIRMAHPRAGLSLLSLDLADLDSIKAAADSLLTTRRRLDLLINNAGVMVPPLSGQETLKLLGEPSEDAPAREARLTALLGVGRSLLIVLPEGDHCLCYLRRPCPAFAGMSVLQIMLAEGLAGIERVREFLAGEAQKACPSIGR